MAVETYDRAIVTIGGRVFPCLSFQVERTPYQFGETPVPADYETCGTCGYDHSYDLDHPSIRAAALRAHQEAGGL